MMRGPASAPAKNYVSMLFGKLGLKQRTLAAVIADLTSAACCDRAAIRNLLKAHRKATARGGQVRFAIRPAARCTSSPASATPTRCSRPTPPSSTP